MTSNVSGEDVFYEGQSGFKLPYASRQHHTQISDHSSLCRLTSTDRVDELLELQSSLYQNLYSCWRCRSVPRVQDGESL